MLLLQHKRLRLRFSTREYVRQVTIVEDNTLFHNNYRQIVSYIHKKGGTPIGETG